MLKKIVTFSLISALSATVVILVVGLFVPEGILARYIQPKSNPETVATIAIDENGNKIKDATVIRAADGSTKVVDSQGREIDNAQTTTTPSSATGNPSPSPSPTPAPAPAPAPSPTPSPAPAPAPPPPPACGAGGPCTATQVATHNSASNCWMIYNNKVYNVTGYISRHSGGSSVFNSNTCGKNVAPYFAGTRDTVSGERYTHSSSDISEINSYYIAELQG